MFMRKRALDLKLHALSNGLTLAALLTLGTLKVRLMVTLIAIVA